MKNLILQGIPDPPRAIKPTAGGTATAQFASAGPPGRAGFTGTCNHCQKVGHRERSCWLKHPELKKRKAESDKTGSGENPSKKQRTEEHTHEVSIAFVWMPETLVPIKEDPATPPPKPKKGYKRARAPDSPEAPRVMTRRRAAQQGEAAMAEKGEEVVVKKEGKGKEVVVKKEEEEATFGVLDDISDESELPSVAEIIGGASC
jgi:hypothetical protein